MGATLGRFRRVRISGGVVITVNAVTGLKEAEAAGQLGRQAANRVQRT
jgi:hypothetical protein